MLESFLGIDIGGGGIKLVELAKENKRGKLLTYGFSQAKAIDAAPGFLETPKETGELIKKICQKAGAKSKRVITSLPVASIFSSIVSVPKLSTQEIEEAIKLKAQKLSSLPPEEMVLDWKILSEPLAKEKEAAVAPKQNVRVLLTGAPKSLIKKYIEIFQYAELELLSLETEAFALIRALIGKDKSVALVIDIGRLKTTVLVVEAGIPVFSRAIDFGGDSVTAALSRGLAIPKDKAEEIKNDAIALQEILGVAGDAATPELFKGLFEPLIAEIRYSLDAFKEQQNQILEGQAVSPARIVEKIVLTGGSSTLPFIAGYLQSVFKTRTFLGSPWARVIYPENLRPLLEQIGSRFSVAVGLALRNIEE